VPGRWWGGARHAHFGRSATHALVRAGFSTQAAKNLANKHGTMVRVVLVAADQPLPRFAPLACRTACTAANPILKHIGGMPEGLLGQTPGPNPNHANGKGPLWPGLSCRGQRRPALQSDGPNIDHAHPRVNANYTGGGSSGRHRHHASWMHAAWPPDEGDKAGKKGGLLENW
jgi:hypothetical protein